MIKSKSSRRQFIAQQVGEVLLYEVLLGNPYEVEFVTIASIVDKPRARA
jgi:hypothetical protein